MALSTRLSSASSPTSRTVTVRNVRVQAVPRPTASPAQQAASCVAGLTAALLLSTAPAQAAGLESIDLLPSSIDTPAQLAEMSKNTQSKLDAAEDAFQQSSTLKDLLAKSEANKAKNKKAIQEKYCYRQAELGIGDCGGLRYIPGLTESGKQKTPQWLADLLGVEVPDSDPTGGKSLKELVFSDGEEGGK